MANSSTGEYALISVELTVVVNPFSRPSANKGLVGAPSSQAGGSCQELYHLQANSARAHRKLLLFDLMQV
jgi:hypothetical protein